MRSFVTYRSWNFIHWIAWMLELRGWFFFGNSYGLGLLTLSRMPHPFENVSSVFQRRCLITGKVHTRGLFVVLRV